ncbi:MAG: N-acetylmuramic acid 6-phosphate etherase, partial [Colwellia sp.]|nr:N-acetylmuramic acid 6-phosphate etherase [Colwellia sp.]
MMIRFSMKKALMKKQSQLIDELKSISTEGQNQDTLDIDMLDAIGVLEKINNEDQKVASVVKQLIPEIAQAVDKIVAAFAKGG